MKKNISNGFEIVENLIKLRWVPEILESIDYGNQRYSEIKRSIDGISHTELNRKLIILIRKGTILKEEDLQSTSYYLLEFGKELIHIFGHLEELQEKYLKPFV
ncbi:MAG: winged helix-turn-helix transcriptional regulator [Tissierella sp.]|uniref:winged helix-turn-helix transcriptional regulator n=1 Tax=Tissierella sp. TaxID=41274 RepID=UPI003F9CA214